MDTCVLLSQIISYSDTKGLVLVTVVMECKRACKYDLCIGVFTSYFKGQQSIVRYNVMGHNNLGEFIYFNFVVINTL